MSIKYHIPRHCLATLLIAQWVVLGPHLLRVPLWVSVVAVVSALWRLLLYTGRGFYPSAVLKGLLVFVSAGAIVWEYGNLFSLDPIVALLVTTFALKLIEMKSRRDVLVVIFLAYFVAATHFLFEQGIATAIYVLLAGTLVTGAMIALHQTEDRPKPQLAFGAAAKLIAQAIPLTIIMFIVFPRIDPLWSVPGLKSGGKTGPSDSMAPGDISSLAGSSKLSFRVEFEGRTPSADKLYWRGLVFSHFNGRRWRERGPDEPRNQPDEPFTSANVTRGEPYSYTVTQEANRQPWLYTLPIGRSVSNGVKQQADFTLRSTRALNQRFQYQVSSWLTQPIPESLDSSQKQKQLQLPDGFNPDSRQWAEKLRSETDSARQYVAAVLQHFNQQPYVYTIRPPELGRHSVDEFMFQSRRGFCEHYASSFVFLMRAAGVPARVVVGYQGGEVNPFENYLLVHEFDAHAWAEVWYEGSGWQRVDPTAAVAPERIESSINDVLADEVGTDTVLGRLNLHDLALARWMRLRWDSVNYSWSKWVLNYDTELQMQVLEDWLGKVDGWRIAMFVLLAGGGVMLLVALSLLQQKVAHKLHPVDKTYLQHTRLLKRLGLQREEGEGASSFALRVAEQKPELADAAQKIASLYSRIRYDQAAGAQEGADNNLHAQLRETVAEFKRQALQKRAHTA